MPTLLKPWKRVPRDAEPQEPDLEVIDSPAGSDRLMLLVPEGGLSFRLLAFSAIEPAQAYLDSQGPALWPEGIVAFWALDSQPGPQGLDTSDQGAEAVVMIREVNRPGVVQLCSFVDMAAACSFLRDSLANGLDLGLVLLYWASLVSLDAAPGARSEGAVASIPAAHLPGRTPPPIESLVHSAAHGQPTGGKRGRAKRVKAEAGPMVTPSETADKRGQLADDMKKREPLSLARILAQVNAWPGWDGLAVRMVAASLLNREVYEDLKRDQHATGRAALIVSLGGLAAGIGAVGAGPVSVFWHALLALAGLGAYFGAVYVFGTWMLGGRHVSTVRFFQAAGLASSPSLLLILGGAVPIYGPLFALAVSVWVPMATAVALTSVFEVNRESAILAAAIGWPLFFAVSQVAPALLA